MLLIACCLTVFGLLFDFVIFDCVCFVVLGLLLLIVFGFAVTFDCIDWGLL